MSKTILTTEQESNIIQDYLKGISQCQLAIKYNVSTGTIKRALVRNQVHIRTHPARQKPVTQENRAST